MSINALTNNKLTTIFRMNILLAVVVLVASIYFMITNNYANLTERQHTETILNVLMVGSLVYAFMIWVACRWRNSAD